MVLTWHPAAAPIAEESSSIGWADLEGLLRGYVARTGRQLVVVTGLDFFNLIAGEEQIEAAVETGYWIPEVAAGDVAPISPTTLPRGHFNTVQAKLYMSKERRIRVVGKVVSSRYSFSL
ncbi:MAG: hypothetical protein AAFN92_00425 [Bacteroidota bacterium]